MKLEIKHLAPYLPYGLKMQANHTNLEYSMMTLCDKTGLSNIGISDVIDDVECFKPILRPLSDLTKPYKNDATYAEFVGIRHIINDEVESEHYYYDGSSRYVHIQHLTFSDFMILVENHFDVFGLIPNGLAIDINTIK